MNVQRLINGKYSPYILAVILGLGLACIFRQSCKDKKCIVFKAPAFEEIHDKTFKFDDKCYKFKHEATSCENKERKIVDFA